MHAEINGALSTSENHMDTSQAARRGENHQNSYGYEEFFGGSVQCPTCKGNGRIPREQESQLVALIPFNDKRLKPRRTVLYVCITVALCLVTAGLLTFFLLPRNVQLTSVSPDLEPSNVTIINKPLTLMLSVTNRFNISNSNFFEVTVESLQLQANFDQQVLSKVTNLTKVQIPIRSHALIYAQMNMTFTGLEDYLALYCNETTKYGHQILIPFSATAEISFLHHSEETTLTTYQYVRCSKSKNMTLSPHPE